MESQAKTHYLSNLSATKNSPLYTTYAAAIERSEFTLDQGYHFRFYESSRGADFITDKAGDICLAFKKGDEYVYELADMAEEPVITASYPDLVRYHYFPFPNIRVEAIFLVYSSRVALLDITIQNNGEEETEIEVIPFLQNNYRAFNEIEFTQNGNYLTFTHEELPDGWVLGHDVPYVDKVQNLLLLSRSPQRMTSYRSYQWGTVEIPHQVDLEKKPVYVVWGRVTHADGERCRHQPPKANLMAFIKNDKSRILTETAPRWGSTDRNITGYGYFGIELGNFKNLQNGDSYQLQFACHETGQSGKISGTIEELDSVKNKRIDLALSKNDLPNRPSGLRRDIWGSGTEIRLYWQQVNEEASYNVYRRDYRDSGMYELLAANIEKTFYTDKNIGDDKIYGYVITAVNANGEMSMPSDEVNNIAGSDFLTDMRYPEQNVNYVKDLAKVIAAPLNFILTPGQEQKLRIIRAVAPVGEDQQKLLEEAQKVLDENPDHYVQANEKLFAKVPRLTFDDPDREMLYWNAFTLMRQVMLPPEGKCGYNYYVFSREPTWGWGHGGQVFHESLTMLAYAYMDPQSAMNSQRVYLERQHESGYINYRTGPYLDETIPHNDQLTTSAPWYAWQNWEIYKITGDEKFLKEMYASSKAFYNYVVSNRDSDDDGLYEWGAHAVLESVRDGLVAVWSEVGWPSNFEAVDMNTMLVSEMKALSAMAEELDRAEEANQWKQDADALREKINDLMWDEDTGFYYHVDKKGHVFTFKKPDDLKREEIIGFLPLWAGVATEAQAKRLVEKLRDPTKFWRKYGIPTLAADDPYYDDQGYWNGPVWVQWNYLIERGLLNYGYKDLAKELVDRVAKNMIEQLKKDHQLWELYSPDEQWAGHHKQYIWAGIIARMMMEVQE